MIVTVSWAHNITFESIRVNSLPGHGVRNQLQGFLVTVSGPIIFEKILEIDRLETSF